MPTVIVLLLGLLGLAMPPRLRVEIAFEGALMQPRLKALAMEEVGRIWAAYGVDVHASNQDDVGPRDAVRLSVALADHADLGTATNTLGSIQFVDDSPKPTILVYPNAIATIVSRATIMGRSDREWSPSFRDVVLGRVLGRVLAHEIGHFLLSSRHHSATGLMRARQPVYELIAPTRRAFALSSDDITRLVSTLSTSDR